VSAARRRDLPLKAVIRNRLLDALCRRLEVHGRQQYDAANQDQQSKNDNNSKQRHHRYHNLVSLDGRPYRIISAEESGRKQSFRYRDSPEIF
jgi:hypothetical protein